MSAVLLPLWLVVLALSGVLAVRAVRAGRRDGERVAPSSHVVLSAAVALIVAFGGAVVFAIGPAADGASRIDSERQSERTPVDKAADYIDNNQQRLRYDQALAQGLPIATGVIEGACRHLVKDRMDITGARWGLQRAEAILKLRSLKVSGDLAPYLTFHFEQEQKRNYPGPPVPLISEEVA